MAHTIPFWLPQVGDSELAKLEAVVRMNYLNEGEVTVELERALTQLLGVNHAVAATSGTAALFLALSGCGIGPGDEVIVPDVTFIASANAVKLAGAEPVLADVDPSTLTIAPEAAERAITARTKAIMPVHVSGRGADLPALQQIARRHGLTIVEDAAEALASRAFGKCLGTIGKAGCFSLSPNKTITTGQGGVAVTDDEGLAVRMRELKDQGRPTRGTAGADVHPTLGYNFKLTNMQAAVGLAQLERLPPRVSRLRDIYRWYRIGLDGLDDIRLLPFDIDEGACPQWIDALVRRRDALDDYLSERNVRCRRFWYPLHTQKPYRLPDDRFPVSSRLWPQALWLPSAFTLDEKDIQMVCRHIHNFFRTRG